MISAKRSGVNLLEKAIKEQKALRADMIKKRDDMPTSLRKELSERICRNVCSLSEFQSEERIFAYYPMRSEVDITPIFDLPKAFRLPRTLGDDMDFYSYRKGDILKEGRFGVREPDPDTAQKNGSDEGIMIVPGVVFSREGHRIGYGKGYYDRYLAASPMLITIGVCYCLQVVERFAVKSSDIALDIIVTEDEIIRTGINI